MWGQEKSSDFRPHFGRIIPTRVGTRTFRVFDSSHFGDHPHACGDKTPYRISAHSRKGSSPRVWGQGYTKNLNINNGGIIPTRVGTRYSILATFKAYRDHPHACGDKCYRWQACRYKSGSSPRVWGQVLQFMRRSCLSRIIPTRVGTSHSDTR